MGDYEDYDELGMMVAYSDGQAIEEWLRHGKNIDVSDEEGTTSLFLAQKLLFSLFFSCFPFFLPSCSASAFPSFSPVDTGGAFVLYCLYNQERPFKGSCEAGKGRT